jgi:hypothetical protein
LAGDLNNRFMGFLSLGLLVRRGILNWRSIRNGRATYLFFAVTMNGTTLIIRWNWQKLFSYGEVVCFVSAWAIGLVVALQSQRTTPSHPNAQTLASATDTLGIQATLSR